MAGSEATYPIKITFDSPGACPPVYVAGSFTVREWHPQELNYSVNERKDNKTSEQPSYTFFRTFDVPVGTFQYKFRLGIGDWWVCDSNGEIVTDALGNHNNRLVVTSEPQESGHTSAAATPQNMGPASSNPKGNGESARSTEQGGPRGNLTSRRRTDQHGSSSTASSTESKELAAPPPPPVESILQRMLRWLKSILVFLFRRRFV